MVVFIFSAANLDYERLEQRVSLSDSNPFEELLIPITDDTVYEGPVDEVFFVQVRLDPNGQNSERVVIVPDLSEVSVNIIDSDLRPGIATSIELLCNMITCVWFVPM